MGTITELCPHCEYEVKLNAVKHILQKCPLCGEMIRACSMCEYDSAIHCIDCAKEDEELKTKN